MEGNSHSNQRKPERHKQVKPKAKHSKTHINQSNKNQTQSRYQKQQGKRNITNKGIPIRITAEISIEALQSRRDWQDILKVLKEKNLQPRLL